MALADAALLQAILDFSNLDPSGDQDNTQVAQALATAIQNYVKTGTVIIAGGSSSGTYPVV